MHNTPFGDIVDTEDDLQPLVASMFRDATRAVTLVAAAMRGADFDVPKLASRAGLHGTTLTELADTLVRDHGLPFRSAHAIAALLLKARTEDPGALLSDALSKASRAILGRRAGLHRAAARDDHEPAALRRGPHHLRRPGALRDRAGAVGLARARWRATSRPGSSAVTTSPPPSEPFANAWRRSRRAQPPEEPA